MNKNKLIYKLGKMIKSRNKKALQLHAINDLIFSKKPP